MRFLAHLFARRAAPVPLTLFVRKPCGLCDVMRAELESSNLAGEFELEIVDLDREAPPALRGEYGDSVPVLALGKRVLCKGRIPKGGFEQRFRRLAAEYRSAKAHAPEDMRCPPSSS